MAKIQKDHSNQNTRSMLNQKTGSMLDKKTNEDFNNEHPDHNEAGLIKGDASQDNNIANAKQPILKKDNDTKLKNKKQ